PAEPDVLAEHLPGAAELGSGAAVIAAEQVNEPHLEVRMGLWLGPWPDTASDLGALEVALEGGLEIEELEVDAADGVVSASLKKLIARGGRVVVELAVPLERLVVLSLADAAASRHEAGVAVNEALMRRFGKGRAFLNVAQPAVEIAAPDESAAEKSVGDR